MSASSTIRTVLHEVPLDVTWIRGAVEIERTGDGLVVPHRIPTWARPRVPDPFMVETTAESAGVRLAVRTAADVIEIDYDGTRIAEDEQVNLAPGVWDVTEDGRVMASASAPPGHRYLFSFEQPDRARVAPGASSTVRLEGLATGTERDLEIWAPYTDAVRLRAVRADGPVTAAPPTRALRWVHHGSSISHGYAADSTTGTWPVVAALKTGVELTNLAYSGSALLDQFVARIIRDQPADVISLKIGINLVNGDHMRTRAFRTAMHGFLDTIRDGHPSTPIVLASPIWCEPVERFAGPTVNDPSKHLNWCIAAGTVKDVAEGKLCLEVIRSEIETIVDQRRASDTHLTYVDGLSLYGPGDARTMPLPDNLHPGPDVQRLIGRRWARDVLTGFAR